MSKTKSHPEHDPEISAIALVHSALKELDIAAQGRVISYVAGKLGIQLATHGQGGGYNEETVWSKEPLIEEPVGNRTTTDSTDSSGISPVALKWMKRNGFATGQLSKLFSIGGEEIDLITESVPGKSKTQRMHQVLLLKAIASYLGTGVARVSHEQLREACLHYDAYDSTNFAKQLKGLAAEISGTKESGFTLTPRGLTKATEAVKALLDL